MSKQIFKVGDRVFDVRYGWGKVTNYYDLRLYPIGVQFDEDDSQEVIFYSKDGKTSLGDNKPLLSFEEYTLQGFTQEKLIDYTEYEGKWGKFYNNEDSLNKSIEISMLEKIEYKKIDGVKFASIATSTYYDNFTPLSDEQLEMLGLK